MVGGISIGVVGSIDHDYPIIEVYIDDELCMEIVTSYNDFSVEALVGDATQQIDIARLAAIMERLLPIWRRELIQRDQARNRPSPL